MKKYNLRETKQYIEYKDKSILSKFFIKIYQYTPEWLLYFIEGITNIFKWNKILYHNKNWDYAYIYDILEYKLLLQRNYIVDVNRIEEESLFIKNKRITLCLNLIQLLKNDFYTMEHTGYYQSNLKFIPTELDNKEYFKIESTLIYENFDEYINKNKLTYKKVLDYLEKNKDSYNDIDKQLICLKISEFKHNKARKLLFNTLEQNIERWWD